MKSTVFFAALAGALLLASCNDKVAEGTASARELTADAIGNYCGMSVLEHAGPKAQIILTSRAEPVWFSSARDAFSFTMLPDEPKDIRAIYVSDMGKAASWDKPGSTNWIEARQAHYVIGSRIKGGMGANETVPFSDRSVAERFAAVNGGEIKSFTEVPREYVLGTGGETISSIRNPVEQHGHGSASAAPGRGHGHGH